MPLPVDLSALALVALILRVYLGREAKAREQQDARISALEAEASQQRHLKHMVINQLAGITGTIRLIQVAAGRCTCGAVAPLLPLIENLLQREDE